MKESKREIAHLKRQMRIKCVNNLLKLKNNRCDLVKYYYGRKRHTICIALR